MRLKSLKLKNFGSYKDAEIDFSKVSNSPIVIITGDTGSGKSTLLDGIVFSLYQSMFRYGRDDIASIISSLLIQNTESSEVQTASSKVQTASLEVQTASSEVSFYLRDRRLGVDYEYLIRRSIASAGVSNTYNVEIKRRSLNGVEWSTFSDTKTNLDKRIKDEILRCSPELFFRSVVLPQGQFASLLKTDDPETRRKIMQEIFSELGIYEKIKNQINKRFSEVKNELSKKESQIDYIKEKNIKKLVEGLTKLGINVVDFSNFDKNHRQYLSDTLARIDERLAQLEKSKKSFEAERNEKQDLVQKQKSRLDSIGILYDSRKKAMDLVGVINSSLFRLVKSFSLDVNKLNSFASGSVMDYSDYINYVRDIVIQSKAEAEKNERTLYEIINRYRSERNRYLEILDKEKSFIEGLKKGFRDIKSDEFRDIQGIFSIQNAVEVIRKIQENVEKKLQVKNKELQSLKDENIDEKFKELGKLGETLKSKEDIQKDILKKNQEMRKLNEEVSLLEEELRKISSKLEDIKREEIRYFAYKIRSSLNEGDRCPVCGGVYHEDAYQSDKSVDNYEVLSREIKKLEEEKSKKESEISTTKGQIIAIESDLSKLYEDLKKKEQELTSKGILTYEQFKEYEVVLKRKVDAKKSLEDEVQILKDGQGRLKTHTDYLDSLIRENEAKRQEMKEWMRDALNKIRDIGIVLDQSFSGLDEFFKKDLDRILANHQVSLGTVISEMGRRLEDLSELKSQNEIIQRYRGISEDIVGMDLQTLDKLKSDLESQISRLSGDIDLLNGEITKIANQTGYLEETKNNIEEAFRELFKEIESLKEITMRYNVLKSLNEKFDTKGIINYVVKLKMSEIAENVNEYLRKLGINDKILEVNFETDRLSFSVRHLVSYEVKSINSLSGGESFLFSVALAFAVANDVLQHLDIKSMFIDEGFDTLDEGYNTKLFKFLEEFAIERGITIYIITHKREIAENTNYPRILVSKENGVSKVEIQSFELV